MRKTQEVRHRFIGRFHALDLARELDALGGEVCFDSYVPHRRALRLSLPARCHTVRGQTGGLALPAGRSSVHPFGPRATMAAERPLRQR